MNKDEIMNQLKEILNKYPNKQREILLYIFGRDNLIKMINEPTYEELSKENQELKLELSGYRQAILNNKEMLGLKEDNDKLKKQLEEHKKEKQEWINLLDMFKNQQKEFINYLENMLDDENDIFSVVRVKDVLQKYKSIIGVSDGDKTTLRI